jgi:hypothetical protein
MKSPLTPTHSNSRFGKPFLIRLFVRRSAALAYLLSLLLRISDRIAKSPILFPCLQVRERFLDPNATMTEMEGTPCYDHGLSCLFGPLPSALLYLSPPLPLLPLCNLIPLRLRPHRYGVRARQLRAPPQDPLLPHTQGAVSVYNMATRATII